MSSFQVATSLSASFAQSQALAAQSSSSDSEGSKSSRLAAAQQTSIQASLKSSFSITGENGNSLSISTEAEFALKFSQSTQLAVDQHGKSPLFGSRQLPINLFSQGAGSLQQSQDTGAGTLFDRQSLGQQIYEDNLALFDDFIRNNGNELTKENVKKFVDLMKQTIPEGFSQARSRLSGHDVMTDGDSETLKNTKSDVMEKLKNFEKTMIDRIENGEIDSVDDLKFSELPGVESSSRGQRLGRRVGLSVELVQSTKITIGQRSEFGSGTTEASGDSSTSSSDSSDGSRAQKGQDQGSGFNVNSLTNSLFNQGISLLQDFFGGENGLFSGSGQEQEAGNLLESSLSAGIDRAKNDLSANNQIGSGEADKLDQLKTRIKEKVDEVRNGRGKVPGRTEGSEESTEDESNSSGRPEFAGPPESVQPGPPSLNLNTPGNRLELSV